MPDLKLILGFFHSLFWSQLQGNRNSRCEDNRIWSSMRKWLHWWAFKCQISAHWIFFFSSAEFKSRKTDICGGSAEEAFTELEKHRLHHDAMRGQELPMEKLHVFTHKTKWKVFVSIALSISHYGSRKSSTFNTVLWSWTMQLHSPSGGWP